MRRWTAVENERPSSGKLFCVSIGTDDDSARLREGKRKEI